MTATLVSHWVAHPCERGHVSSGSETNGMVDWYIMVADPSTLVGHISSS